MVYQVTKNICFTVMSRYVLPTDGLSMKYMFCSAFIIFTNVEFRMLYAPVFRVNNSSKVNC